MNAGRRQETPGSETNSVYDKAIVVARVSAFAPVPGATISTGHCGEASHSELNELEDL